MSIRIGFDATATVQGAGVGRYSASLLRALLGQIEDEWYILIATKDVAEAAAEALPAATFARLKALPFDRRMSAILWQRLRLPLPVEWLAGGGLDVFHSPDYLLPPLHRAKGVVTVHDLSFMRRPEFAYPALAAYLSKAVPRSVARAEVVLADSQSTADDVAYLCKVPEERVRVVYPGVAEHFAPEAEEGEAEGLEARYGLRAPYVLSVGTIEPRKNYRAMIEAFVDAAAQERFEGQYAIAGAGGWLSGDSLRAAGEAGRRVRLLGRVDEADLPALYRQATALVYASHYEGFGLPPLEAMACGTPVVVADTSSIPEVVEDAGAYCSTDRDSIAEALAAVLADGELRQRLSAAGLRRAERFSWERAAQEVRWIYHEVA